MARVSEMHNCLLGPRMHATSSRNTAMPWSAITSQSIYTSGLTSYSDMNRKESKLQRLITVCNALSASSSKYPQLRPNIIIIVFHPLTYEGAADITTITDWVQRQALLIQINEFGQTPKQVFKDPHPKRFSRVRYIYDHVKTEISH